MEISFTIPIKRPFTQAYQIKISLLGTKIWRRILVPKSYTFYDLHVAIQNAMGWTDSHLHCFEQREKNKNSHKRTLVIDCPYGAEEYEREVETIYVTETPITKIFKSISDSIYYVYDFGDTWEHSLVLENIIPKVPGIKYPLCVGGKLACPPEDCGATPGYYECIKASQGKGRKELLEWLDPDWDPNYFDLKKVKFQNPRKRFLETMEN